MSEISVIIPIYNVEKYLKECLNSISNQSFRDLEIICVNDGSTDNSADIIESYCNDYPNKISCIKGQPTGNAKNNFAELLKNCDSEYIMFSDQDDIWLPQKIEKTLAAMQDAERNGKKPFLVHTDLKVVGENLDEISPSFFDFQKLLQNDITLPKLLVQNYVTGCTVMINSELKEKCGEIPNDCIMHDWWLALVAILFGDIICVNEATMLYRQHSGNQVGAKASYGLAFIKRKLATLNEVRKNYNATYTQASTLLDCYGEILSDEQKNIIEKYCEIPQMCKFKKIRTIKKFGFKKCTRLRVMGQYFLT